MEQIDPRVRRLITNGISGDAGNRYEETVESHPLELGALLVLATAIQGIPLDDHKSPLDDYYWEVIWDLLAPDRFWAWVDVRLADRIRDLASLHAFAPEPNPAVWHKGIVSRIDPATRSWKQTRFDVTNVQLTFHETSRRRIDTPDGKSMDCVVVEPDIDLYKDLLAHGLTEVVPNLLTGGKTDPRTVYALRWMASRQEHEMAEFTPPVTVE